MIIHKDRKQLKIDSELINICKQITIEDKNDNEWSNVESSKQFQTPKYCGGYDPIEQEFCFSYYEGDEEFWFSFSLRDVDKIVNNELLYLDLMKVI